MKNIVKRSKTPNKNIVKHIVKTCAARARSGSRARHTFFYIVFIVVSRLFHIFWGARPGHLFEHYLRIMFTCVCVCFSHDFHIYFTLLSHVCHIYFTFVSHYFHMLYKYYHILSSNTIDITTCAFAGPSHRQLGF